MDPRVRELNQIKDTYKNLLVVMNGLMDRVSALERSKPKKVVKKAAVKGK